MTPIPPIPIVIVAIIVAFVDFIGNHRTAGATQAATNDRTGLAADRAANGRAYRPTKTAAQRAVERVAGNGRTRCTGQRDGSYQRNE